MNNSNKIKRITRLSIFITLALILSYIETLIPAMPIPGAKIGLANIITLVALYSMSYMDAFIIVIMRTILSSLLFASLSALMYSMPAGIVSLIVMLTVIRITKESKSFITVSLLGALAHNLTQLLVATMVLQTFNLGYLLPWMIILAIPTGLFIGVVTQSLIKSINRGISA